MHSLDLKFVHDPLHVAEYAKHIFDYYKKNERKELLRKHWMTTKFITVHHWAKAVKFFINWSHIFRMEPETPFLAINLMDWFIFHWNPQVENLSQIFVACNLLACKFLESQYISLDSFISNIRTPLSKNQII